MLEKEKVQIILGPPGTGKTTALLTILNNILKEGVDAGKIGFISFARKTIEEVCERVNKQFGLVYKDLPYFRTTHSLCFRQLGLSADQVMRKKNYAEIGTLLGMEFRGYEFADSEDLERVDNSLFMDRYVFLDSLARSKMNTHEEQWNDVEELKLSWTEFEYYSKTLAKYKEENCLLDFTDILENFLQAGASPKLHSLFVDEAQDLSKLQWYVISKLAKNSEHIYIAGDDDQAVFTWSGADVDTFISLEGESKVLNKSYRLPKKIHALSQDVVKNISKRLDKPWTHNGEEGQVSRHTDAEDVPLKEGEWFILARNRYLYKEFEEICIREGYSYITMSGVKTIFQSQKLQAIKLWTRLKKGDELPLDEVKIIYKYMVTGTGIAKGFKSLKDASSDILYTLETLKENHGLLLDGEWFETLTAIEQDQIDYIRRARKNGESLSAPRITMSTIHSTKGGECDNVLIITDMSKRTYDDYIEQQDNETRVFYVAITRAKKHLHILEPQTPRYFDL